MTATGSTRARGNRHSIKTVTRTKEMFAEGLTADTIVWLLAQEGIDVSPDSVKRWTNVKRSRDAQRSNERWAAKKAKTAGAKPMGPKTARPEYKLARMRALSETVKLKDAQIARLMTFDFGDAMNRAQVAYALEHGRFPYRDAWHQVAREMLERNPSLTYAEVGRRVGVTGAAVSMMLKREAERAA